MLLLPTFTTMSALHSDDLATSRIILQVYYEHVIINDLCRFFHMFIFPPYIDVMLMALKAHQCDRPNC